MDIRGYAYVKNGKIKMSVEEKSNMNNKYVVLLVKYPLNTFNTSNTNIHFKTFAEVLEKKDEGSFGYKTSGDKKTNANIVLIAMIAIIIWSIYCLIKKPQKKHTGRTSSTINRKKIGYFGYKNNRIIDNKTIPMYREIPCNKDIYYANALLKFNNHAYEETNIFGAIILKWIRDNKIEFLAGVGGLIKKDDCFIDLKLNPTFDRDCEVKLFDAMYEASDNGILDPMEFESWCKWNYSKFLDIFYNLVDSEKKLLQDAGHIYKRTNKNECKYANIMDDTIYEDSKQLYGLKKYLKEFSLMGTKEVMEVKIWDEYLMFAYLFGITDKVYMQLKNMYPTFVDEIPLDLDIIQCVSDISSSSYLSASTALSSSNKSNILSDASSYSGGGGGFSSGGGGGGSFGSGGGGGSR